MCMEGAAEEFLKLTRTFKEGVGGAGVEGSPRFGVYEVDFGWGQKRWRLCLWKGPERWPWRSQGMEVEALRLVWF
ncbi:hypothetical protein TIFTF001_046133 [Ficus carica]|uniref:Uncharacterized protein n=1 Tax=Ficus carica TaxID=3494 RepID=A0AA87Z0V5_FICCA|nr:hypothetical protein TIFTF001_046133 [Ficus carica]